MFSALDKARITAAHDQIRTFKTALLTYKIDNGHVSHDRTSFLSALTDSRPEKALTRI